MPKGKPDSRSRQQDQLDLSSVELTTVINSFNFGK
jgi:hypothetical protein